MVVLIETELCSDLNGGLIRFGKTGKGDLIQDMISVTKRHCVTSAKSSNHFHKCEWKKSLKKYDLSKNKNIYLISVIRH